MRLNVKQRRVIEIVLICAAALLLLGLIIDAADQATPGLSRANAALLRKYGLGFQVDDFIPAVLRSPRLYIAGLLIGLAIFIHQDSKDEKN